MAANPDPSTDDTLRADLASLRIARGAPPPRRQRRSPRGWWIALVGVLAIGMAAWLALRPPPAVRVAVATRTTAAQLGPAPVLSGSGYIVTGDRYVSIGVRVPGRIERYFVEEGQHVHHGDPLVQLDDRDYRAAAARTEASLRLARANVALAESELRRGEALRRENVISQQEVDVLRNKAAVSSAALAQIEAELQQAQVNLDYTVLRAPTDGVVLAKQKEVGEIAVPGGFAGSGDLIRLANLSDIRAQVDVNEADLKRVRMGQNAQVIPDAYPDATYAAEVVKMYPQVDRQKGTLRVEVRVQRPDGNLLPDMSARVVFLSDAQVDADTTEPETVVLVPAAAVQRDERGDSVVWWVRDGRATVTRVDTGGEVGGQVRIARGLSGGETVIVGEPPKRDGMRVQIAAE